MNESIIDKLLEYIDQTKDFVLDQAPDIFNQIIQYSTMSIIMWTCSLGSLTVIGCTLIFIYLKNYRRESIFDHGYALFSLWLTPFLLFGTIVCADELIKVKVAPKYYIIKKLINIKR